MKTQAASTSFTTQVQSSGNPKSNHSAPPNSQDEQPNCALSPERVVNALELFRAKGDSAAQLILAKLLLGVEDTKYHQTGWLNLFAAARGGEAEAKRIVGGFDSLEMTPPEAQAEILERLAKTDPSWGSCHLIAVLLAEASAGNAHAQCELIEKLNYSKKKPLRFEMVSWLKEAAENGHIDAKFQLGVMLMKGESIQLNKELGVQYLCEAAESGSASAAAVAGVHYLEGADDKSINVQRGMEYCRAAALKGDVPAMILLGITYATGAKVPQDIKKAIYWLRKSADCGLVSCSLNLAFVLSHSEDADHKAEAVTRLESAVEQGFAPAMHKLGELYAVGKCVDQDAGRAFALFNQAAALGHEDSLGTLGILHFRGTGTVQNYDVAFRLFQQGAQTGDPLAFFNMGVCLLNGHGCEQDPAKGLEFISNAAANGFQPAIEVVKQLLLEQKA
jgi:TPR repeat protein